MRILRATALLAVADLALAQGSGRHPDPQYAVRPNVPEAVVRFADPPVEMPSLVPARVVATIGTEDGATETVFGNMVSAVLFDDTTVVIVDGTIDEIRVFTTDGRHLQTFGRRGAGPGEFRGISVAAVTPRGELVVSDTRRTLQYFRRGARGFEYVRSLSLPVAARELCFLGGTLFASGASYEKGTAISAIDSDGKVIRDFGRVYRSPNALINYQVAQGRIACDAERSLIYYMPGSLLGEVRAFRSTGEEVWRVRLADFLTNVVHAGENGSVSVERSPRGTHSSGGLAIVPGHGLLAQWTFLSRAEMDAKELPSQVHSILMDPSTGAPRSLGTGLGLVRGIREGRAIVLIGSPYPRLEVRTAGSR